MIFNQLKEYQLKKNLYSFLIEANQDSNISFIFDEEDERHLKVIKN